jgi:phage major head subunit gpT-like protein
MAEITPTFVQNFQTNLSYRYQTGWSRTLKNLWVRDVCLFQTSDSAIDYFEWMLDGAHIRPLNTEGDELDFEDLVAQSFSIESEYFGTGLKMYRKHIEDNKYDRAAHWSASVGAAAAYWPQRVATQLLLNGKVNTCFDNLAFFHATHYVNPYDTGLGTYKNLHTSKPLTAGNLAAVVADINAIPHAGDAPLYLKPTKILVDPSNKLKAEMLLGADYYTDPTNTNGTAPATNIIRKSYSFGEPIVVPELACEPGVWYVLCEADQDAFQGGLLYVERKPFELTTYTGATQADLDRLNVLEWHLRGRNKATYGLPYMIHRVEP